MEATQRLTFIVHTRKIVLIFSIITVFLVIADLIGLYSKFILGHPRVFGLVPLFDLDREQTVPALFNTCLFLVNALLFLCVWTASRVTRESLNIFLFLSVLFCYLAIDEFCELHERLFVPIHTKFHTTGIFYYAWFIPVGIGVSVLSIVMFPILRAMEKKPRFWFFLSAFTYICGAIGGDMIAGWYITKKGLLDGLEKNDLWYQIFVLFEESFEMAGLIMLIYALLSLIRVRYGGVSILIPGASDASNTP